VKLEGKSEQGYRQSRIPVYHGLDTVFLPTSIPAGGSDEM